MDEYTKKTKDWLEERYQGTKDGFYFAHQPIYGFRNLHSEQGNLQFYLRSFAIARSLAMLDFESLLDVGGSEGYQGAIARDLLGKTVRTCDLSEEACKRAREVYGLEADQADIHSLPYADGSFDICTCSETIEHVPEPRVAIAELLRVARKGVLVTVPHESHEEVESNIEGDVPHGHINSFDVHSFDYLRDEGLEVRVSKIQSSRLRAAGPFVDGRRRTASSTKKSRVLVGAFNLLLPAIRPFYGKARTAKMLERDAALCHSDGYGGVLAVIAIDPSLFRETPSKRIEPMDLLDRAVPLHRIPDPTA